MKYGKNTNTVKKDMGVLLPVLIALCLIPFVVLTKDYQTEFTQFNWFNMTELDQIDSFEHAKSICVVIMGVAALVFGAIQYSMAGKGKRLLKNGDYRVMGLCAVYFVMVIISSVFSSYPNLAFTGGGYGQWQTMWVLLANVILFLYAYLFVDSENRVSLLVKCMMISTGFLALIGVMQTAGNNPLSWDWVQKIITSRSKVSGISFKEGISNVVITFSNPNYVGPYVALVLPVVVAFVTVRAAKDDRKVVLCRLAGALTAVGLLVSLFGAASSAGAIAVVAGAVVAGVMILASVLTKEPDNDGAGKVAGFGEPAHAGDSDAAAGVRGNSMKRYGIVGVLVLAVLVAGIGVSRTEFFKTTVNKLLQGSEDTRNIASIINSEQGLEVTLRNDEEFVLTPLHDEGKGTTFQAHDVNGKEIPVEKAAEQNTFRIRDERFNMITLESVNFSVENAVYPGFRFNDVPNKISWTFMYKDNEWQYYTPFGKFMKLHAVESFGFENYQNIANRRGFIWSRTIPLMKTYWFKGIGPNAFIIAFPNDDFVGSKRVGGNTTLVDKPHNAFLQIYVQTGGVSAAAYAGLWILYVIQTVRLLWRKKHYTDTEKIALGLLVGMISFAVAGLTNDTVVGSQNIYWILLGTGYAVNRVIKQGREAARLAAEMEAEKQRKKKEAARLKRIR